MVTAILDLELAYQLAQLRRHLRHVLGRLLRLAHALRGALRSLRHARNAVVWKMGQKD